MKLSGHTMGTPELTMSQAIRLFSNLGLEGIEIICDEDYGCGLRYDALDKELGAIKEICIAENIKVSALTPYISDYNSQDDGLRRKAGEGLRKVINAAHLLGAEAIRIYGGKLTSRVPAKQHEAGWKLLCQELRQLADTAKEAGVVLVVENHHGTMTMSAADTVKLVKEIDHPSVGILYDQVNLAFTHQEDYREALEIQKDHIAYVHVKDLEFTNRDKAFAASAVATVTAEERAVRSRIVGQGEMDWLPILRGLKEQGYDGWLSLEYERRWHPQDLPVADVGMKQSAECLRRLLTSLGGVPE